MYMHRNIQKQRDYLLLLPAEKNQQLRAVDSSKAFLYPASLADCFLYHVSPCLCAFFSTTSYFSVMIKKGLEMLPHPILAFYCRNIIVSDILFLRVTTHTGEFSLPALSDGELYVSFLSIFLHHIVIGFSRLPHVFL